MELPFDGASVGVIFKIIMQGMTPWAQLNPIQWNCKFCYSADCSKQGRLPWEKAGEPEDALWDATASSLRPLHPTAILYGPL